ncbi:vitelline membrane outer layer protein 1 homolog [Hyla sarda]|uniref:vitelline membrane outer layer protein 1 homolog n=1 Tax=Hyla sarda TaxID=327740 RepID=UPI0024C35160|nr:vitelline membrane outer layer protein 1 homolog [Hyla sarda]XP_056426001.1 vitelline membrane outer layer protein 1 homolog [Hyla sarda]
MYISVSNGGYKGEWGSTEECPEGSKAMGFKLQVDRKLVTADTTGVNSIYLLCADSSSENVVGTISSSQGDFGNMGQELKCNLGSYLVAFCLNVGKRLLDYIGVANVKFKCSDGMILTGDGYDWATWGAFSEECPNGIRGIKSKREKYQGPWRDDSQLNDASMLCY